MLNSKSTILTVGELAVASLLVTTTFVLLHCSGRRRRCRSAKFASSSWAKVPGSIPWFGNVWQIGGLSRLYEQLSDWADQYGDEHGAYEFSLMGTRFIVVCRQDRILDLMSNHRPFKLVRSNKAKSVANGIGALGLFAAEGKQWSIDRRLVGPALNRMNIRSSYHECMKIVCRRLVEKWRSSCPSGIEPSSTNGVLIHNDLHSVSLDILSLAVYGKDSNSLETLSDKTSKDVMAILDLAMTRMFSPFAYWEIPLIGPYLDGGGWIKNRLIRELDKIISEHEQSIKDIDPTSDNDRSRTFLSKLLALNHDSEDIMPQNRLVGQLLTLFIGGSDSVGTLLVTAFWQLASDLELQESLVEELARLPRGSVGTASMEDMMVCLPRTRSFVMELARCFGPLPTIFLAAAEDLSFGQSESNEKVFIPQGTEIILLTQYANTHPTHPPADIPLGPNGEDPSQFCPQRWLVQTKDSESLEFPSIRSGVHMAFGHGARMCPGKDFAELEVITCIAYVIESFQLFFDFDQSQQRSLHQIRLVLEERKLPH